MIKIYCHQFHEQLADEQWNRYIDQLSHEVRKKILRYYRWQDRHAALFGRLLLRQALCEAGYPLSCLEYLKFDDHGRPSIDAGVDFNISHSGSHVVCAIAEKLRVGIDIECVREMDISCFKAFISDSEWQVIQGSASPLDRFYHYWTIKESVMKADGRGLGISPRDIKIYPDHAIIDNKKWGLKTIPVADNCFCHLAFGQYDLFRLSSIHKKDVDYGFGGNLLKIRVFEVLFDIN